MIEESSELRNKQLPNCQNNDTRKIEAKAQDLQKKISPNMANLPKSKIQSKNSSSSQSSSRPLCINKICPKMKNSNFKEFQSKNHAFDPEELCNQCLIQYKKQAYCLYCKQIYFDSSDDGKQWILCDDCGRWVHSQCANYDPILDSDFKCIKCKKNQPLQNQVTLVKKPSIKPNPKQNDRRKQITECSLNAYGFYWSLAPKQLSDDMDKIRQFLH